MSETPKSMHPLYDVDAALLDRDAFTSSEVFARELETIFHRTWMFVGHESQIPDANDYVCSRMGTDSVIVTRNREGEIHVLLNSCRHKGMRVLRYDEGNAPIFTCPYHAWSYSTNGNLVEQPGQLVGIQRAKVAYDNKLDKQEWGLVNARVDTYKGAIFATWSADAPPLLDYLGDFSCYLDETFDTRMGEPGGTVAIGGVMKWRINANWKVCAENFSGDGMHNISHRSVDLAGIGFGGAAGGRTGFVSIGFDKGERPGPKRDGISHRRFGHGVIGVEPWLVDADDESRDLFPRFTETLGPLDRPEVVDEYFREAARRQRAAYDGTMRAAQPMSVGGIFPNMSFHTGFPRTIGVYHPISPTVTEAWRWFLVDADAPKEVVDLTRHHFMRYSGPAGMTESDDMDNWSYLTESSAGAQARKHPFNYQSRLHAERPSSIVRDAVLTGEDFSEAGLRGYYVAWDRHLRAGDWPEYLALADAEAVQRVG